MTRPCAHCGCDVDDTARFCSACGHPVGDDEPGGPVLDARRLADPTSELGASQELPTRPGLRLGPVVVPSGLTRWWAEPQHRSLVAVAACGALLGAAVGLAFLLGGAGSGPATTRPTHPAVTAPARHRAGPSTSAPSTAPGATPAAFVAQVEALLQQSGNGRTQLVAALSGAQSGCPAGSAATVQQLEAVVTNRSAVLQSVMHLVAPDAETQSAQSLLVSALQASIQADAQYGAWVAAMGVTDGCDQSGARAGPAFRAARAADSSASSLKQQFVNVFNPMAARYGMPTWTETQF